MRLPDETAILACAAYVDLNPIRAAMAKTLEQSDFTSAQKRMQDVQVKFSVGSVQSMEKPPVVKLRTFRFRTVAWFGLETGHNKSPANGRIAAGWRGIWLGSLIDWECRRTSGASL